VLFCNGEGVEILAAFRSNTLANAAQPGYPLQVLARSSLWAFRYYPWPMPARSSSSFNKFDILNNCAKPATLTQWFLKKSGRAAKHLWNIIVVYAKVQRTETLISRCAAPLPFRFNHFYYKYFRCAAPTIL
jgi:hypothetical protein